MESGSFAAPLAERLRQAGVVAVLVIDDLANALPLAETLVTAGVSAIELTLRTGIAGEAITQIRSHFPQVLVGAGTVTSADMVRRVVDAGAQFGVAPGMNSTVVRAAQAMQLPFAPGVCTPSDIESAVELDCRLLKFFPAQPIGGLSYLRAISGPYAHLGLRFVPLGGIDANNAAEYLSEPTVHCIGGSWIAPRGLIHSRDWQTIGARAEQAKRIVDDTLKSLD